MPPVLKSIALAAVASLALAGTAAAADLPRRAAPPVFAPVPVFTWTGFYLGINAGYAFSENDTIRTTGINNLGARRRQPSEQRHQRPAPWRPSPCSRKASPAAARSATTISSPRARGIVVGVEADAQYTDLQRHQRRDIVHAGLQPERPDQHLPHRARLPRHRARPHRLRLRPGPRVRHRRLRLRRRDPAASPSRPARRSTYAGSPLQHRDRLRLRRRHRVRAARPSRS